MRNAETHGPARRRYFMQCVVVTFVMFVLSSWGASQTTTARQPEFPLTQELNKYPGLLPEFGKLIEKLQHNVQFPPARKQSSLLPLLPASTSYYAAFPNYGDAAHQSLMIFRQELQESSVLRDWWQRAALGTSGPQLEDSVEKFYELSQYLGDEIVVSGESGSADHSFVLVAEVRKPGFKNFLEQMLKGLPGTPQPAMRVMDPKELALASDRSTSHEWAVLVRPDFVVAAPNVKAVRDFNELLDKRGRNFAATPFGQRVGQAYQGGAEVLVAADLHNILSHVPLGTQRNEAMFDRSGFNDVKYFVWEHRNEAGRASSEMELSFTGPRHGVAAWLA